MSEVRPIADNKGLNPVKMPNSEFMIFNNLNNFTETVANATGITFDFASVVELHSDILQASEQYLILNVSIPNK